MQAERPLSWPLGWPRAEARSSSRFSYKLTVAGALSSLEEELERAGAEEVVFSSDLPLRVDGRVRAGAKAPEDPGVAVYFLLDGEQTVLACDRWRRIQDNVRAIAKHVEAMRGMDRWGCGSLSKAFSAYRALPERGVASGPSWREVLGFHPDSSPTPMAVRAAYAPRVIDAHPDHGGSAERLKTVQDAYKEACEELGAVR